MQFKSAIVKNYTGRSSWNIADEYQESLAFYEYTQLIPAIKDYMVHFANEGRRSIGYAKRLKRIGGLPRGFPDFIMFLPNNRFHSLFIEMKTRDERGKKQRKEQIMWIDRLNKAGHYATMTYGCDHAIQVTEAYLTNKL
jgi:hypothetical protein